MRVALPPDTMNHRQAFFLALVFVVLALSVSMFLPFLGYILAAGILGYLLHPAQQWLADRVGPTIAAGILVALTIIAVILPLVVAGVAVADDAQRLVRQVQGGQFPDQFGDELDFLSGIFGTDGDGSGVTPGPGMATDVISELLHIGAGLPILVILQFYALRDGHRLVAWSKTFDIIPTDMQDELYREIGTMINAVVKGHIFVAVLQGVVIGAALYATGVPNAVFWTFLMVLMAMIPFIGTPIIWVPAAIYLFLSGQPLRGGVLFAIGAVVATVMDDVLRPILVEGNMELHEAFILIGVIGGIFVFGAIGLFVGPVLFGLLRVLLEMFKTRYPELGG